MENITKIASAFMFGFVDSLRGAIALFYLDRRIREREAIEASPRRNESGRLYPRPPVGPSAASGTPKRPANTINLSPLSQGKIFKRTFECCALNGGLFWMSILLFQFGLMPSVKYCVDLLFGKSSKIGETSWSIIESSLSIIFSTLWILPLTLLSKVVNSIWFQDIADIAYRHSRGKPQPPASLGRLLADVTFSFVVEAFFIVQTVLVGFFPVHPFGLLFALVHNAMLYSLYSFEYKMYNMGWELHRRLHYIEANWPYFIGFGLPLAILTSLADSYTISGIIFAVLFPLFIISANEAVPVTNSAPSPLQLFRPVMQLTNAIFYKLLVPLRSTSRSQQNTSTSHLENTEERNSL